MREWYLAIVFCCELSRCGDIFRKILPLNRIFLMAGGADLTMMQGQKA